MNFIVNSCFRRFFIPVSFFIFLNLPNISFAQRNLGIPVRDAVLWGAYVGPGNTGAQDTIYLSFGQYEAPLFLLAIHPDTGKVRQFNGPLSSEMGSWGWTLDHGNRIYVGSYYHAHLLRFDPKIEIWEDLGQPAGEKDSFICSLTTAPDGKVWGGTFPSTHLFSYDPKTGVARSFGRVDPDQFYAYPTAGEDGLIYCAIQFEKADIVVFDPVHETKTSLIPLAERKPGRVRLVKGRDGKVYARLSSSGQWFRIEEGKKLIEVSEADIPFPSRDLPDGRQFQIVDQKILRIENPSTKEVKEIPFRYEASGAYIFVVGTGPDARIYGSSMLPLRLFAYDPKNEATLVLGKASHSSGEIYSMGSYDGKLYLCSYPEARLSIYDPTKPLRFGDDEEANPRDLGPLGGEQDRPRAMVAGPYGRIYIGSTPDYGLLGGAISVFDPKTKEKRVYRHIIPNQSVASLAYIEKSDLLAAGSSIRGGGGTRPSEKWAKLMLWDPREEKKILEMIPVLEAKAILALAATKEGILYGITDNEKLFIFDVEKRITRKVIDLEFKEPRPASLQLGPDEKLYGLAKEAIFAIDPKNDRIFLLIKPSVPIDSGMAILGRKIYFGSGANLWEFEIPPEKSNELLRE